MLVHAASVDVALMHTSLRACKGIVTMGAVDTLCNSVWL